jgi:hypothetical protein
MLEAEAMSTSAPADQYRRCIVAVLISDFAAVACFHHRTAGVTACRNHAREADARPNSSEYDGRLRVSFDTDATGRKDMIL